MRLITFADLVISRKYFSMTIIFDRPDFVDLHNPEIVEVFEHNVNNKLVKILVPINGNEVVLPLRGSYSFFTCKSRLSLLETKVVVDAFECFLKRHGVKTIDFTFPPSVAHGMINSFFYAMSISGWESGVHDISSLIRLDSEFLSNFSSTARKHLKKSLKVEGAVFREADTLEEWERTYACILKNRQDKGYSLAMSLEQVLQMRIFDVKAFYLTIDGTYFSAVLIYFHTPEYAQIVYWGTILDGEKDRLQYRLVHSLFESLYSSGVKYVDMGTSTNSDSFNSGLLEFKMQIGGKTYMNYNLKKKLE